MKIEKATNIVVLVAAVVIVGLNIHDRLAPRKDVHEVRAKALVGRALQLPPPLSVGYRVTAVLFVSKNCTFCSASMPFYSRSSSLRTQGSGAFRLLAVTPAGRETIADDEQYLAEYQVRVDGIGQLQFDAVGIRGTPTLALLDGSGHVLKAWAGELPSNSEDDIIRTIRRLCPGCEAPRG